MDSAISDRIRKLDGQVSVPANRDSLLDHLKGVRIDKGLYDVYWAHDMWGLSEFYEEHKALWQNDQNAFCNKLLQAFPYAEDPPHGSRWVGSHFTPLTNGTTDYTEWSSWFEESADLGQIREIVGDDEQLEFVHLIHGSGAPDFFFVCLQDPNPRNPTVFGTDHETFFVEISHKGSLLSFLQEYFITDDELIDSAKEFIREVIEDS